MSRLNRYDPEALDFLTHSGINVAELENPRQALLSAGVEKMCRMKGAIEFLERTALKRDLERMIENGSSEKDIERVRKMSEENIKANRHPLWQRLSGMTPEAAPGMDPAERRSALARLHHAVKLLLRHEFGVAKTSGTQSTEASSSEPTSPLEPAPPEKTFLWDPLPEICHYLEISRAALTRFLRELTGVSAHEMVDMVRAEKLKEKMRHVLFPALNLLLTESVEGSALSRSTLWKRLKDSRRNPSFQRAVYAIELGFPNHQRMYRACLLVYGQTPCQIEWELIEEFLSVESEQLTVDSEQQQPQQHSPNAPKSYKAPNSHSSHNSPAV